MPPVSTHQCHIPVPISCLPVHINATYQGLSVKVSAICHCPSVLPVSAA
ncbi:unnamed protein product [Staurois parvus]|uniref:Uncharacterized protein n=1 Tax=Staurois parvus TaxID=386267 RepID=A0ABN9HVT2_9NEOB|nr:unnamed protein product [Staurois parvus]